MGKFKIFNTKILSLMIAFIMLFNLTAPVFAAPQIATKEQKNQITNALNEVYNESRKKSPNTSYSQNIRNRYKRAKENYAVALVKYKTAEEIYRAVKYIFRDTSPGSSQIDPLTLGNDSAAYVTLLEEEGVLSTSNKAKRIRQYIQLGQNYETDFKQAEQNFADAQKEYIKAENSLLSYLQYSYRAELNYRIEAQCKKAQNYYKHIAKGYENIKNGQLFKNPNFYLSSAQKKDSNIQGLAKWDTEVYKRCNTGIVYFNETDEKFEGDTPFKNGWLTPDEFLTLLAQEYYEEYVPEKNKVYEDTWLTPYYSTMYSEQKNLLGKDYYVNKGKEKAKKIFLLLLADYDLGYMQYITTLAKISLANHARIYVMEHDDSDSTSYPDKISVNGFKMKKFYYERYANTQKNEKLSQMNIFDLVYETENYALGHLIELSAGMVKAIYLEHKAPIEYLKSLGINKQDIIDTYNKYKKQQLDLLKENQSSQDDSLKTDEELAIAVSQLGNIDYTGITRHKVEKQYLYKERWERALDYLFILAPSTHITNYTNEQVASSEFNRQIKRQNANSRPIFNQLLTLLSEHAQGWDKGLNPIIDDIFSRESRLAMDMEALLFLTELAVTHEAADADTRAKLINESMYVQNAHGWEQTGGFILGLAADFVTGQVMALAKATRFAKFIKAQIRELKFVKKIDNFVYKLDNMSDVYRYKSPKAKARERSYKTSHQNQNRNMNANKVDPSGKFSEEKPVPQQQLTENIPPSTSPIGKQANNLTNEIKNLGKRIYKRFRKKVVGALIVLSTLNPVVFSSSEVKDIVKEVKIENVVQGVKNDETVIKALDNNPASLEKNTSSDAWISDRPNSYATKPRQKPTELPKQPNVEGGLGDGGKPKSKAIKPKSGKSKKSSSNNSATSRQVNSEPNPNRQEPRSDSTTEANSTRTSESAGNLTGENATPNNALNAGDNNTLPNGVKNSPWASEKHERIKNLEETIEQKEKALQNEKKKLEDIVSDPNGVDIPKRDGKVRDIDRLNKEITDMKTELEELKKSIPPVKKADARYSVKSEKIASVKGNDFTKDEQIKNLIEKSKISEVPADIDTWDIYNTYVRNNSLKFNSEADANLFIKRQSNGTFKDMEELNKALGDPNHPLHQEAKSFIENPAFGDLEVVISNTTPGYATLNMNNELRIPLNKLIANYSGSVSNINIKKLKDGLFGFEFKHTHGIPLDKYINKLLKGDVLSVIRKSDHELLIVYDRVKNNEYVIGIIQENPNRGVNLLVTNYTVKTDTKGLGEQFFTYSENNAAGIRTIIGFNKGEILYLRQPTTTNYNQNAVNKFLNDVRNIRKNTKIGTVYPMYEP